MRTRILICSAAIVVVLSAVAASADSLAVVDLTPQLTRAGLHVDGLRALEVGDIVVLRGRAMSTAEAERAGVAMQRLGYERVANLIEIATPPDDAVIERDAERALTMHRALDDCQFRVASNDGVVHVSGRVRSQVQRDIAVSLVRTIDGVRGVTSDLRLASGR